MYLRLKLRSKKEILSLYILTSNGLQAEPNEETEHHHGDDNHPPNNAPKNPHRFLFHITLA